MTSELATRECKPCEEKTPAPKGDALRKLHFDILNDARFPNLTTILPLLGAEHYPHFFLLFLS